MYFSGELSVDPSECTTIVHVKPEKAFRKFLHFVTIGAVSDKEEYETFTAVSILQQFNRALRGAGITNIVRLAKDDFDFYFDADGKKDDLKEAMEKFEFETDDMDSEVFNELLLVVEHEDEAFKYYIDVKIDRVHKKGEFPISVRVNALNNEFSVADGKDSSANNKLKKVFKTQNTYDEFLASKQVMFEEFLNKLELEIKRFIITDTINRKSDKKLIRPKTAVNSSKSIKHHHDSEPVFYGYYGCDTYLYHTMLWSDMCYSHNIYCNDISIIDEGGADIMSVGDEGFNAGEHDTLNTSEEFEVPAGADTSVSEGSQFDDAIQASDSSVSDSGSSWTDSFFGGGDSSDSGSSCSSSSCGSSCGSSCSSCGS